MKDNSIYISHCIDKECASWSQQWQSRCAHPEIDNLEKRIMSEQDVSQTMCIMNYSFSCFAKMKWFFACINNVYLSSFLYKHVCFRVTLYTSHISLHSFIYEYIHLTALFLLSIMITVPLLHPLFHHSYELNVFKSHPLIPVIRNTRLPLILVQFTNWSMLLESTVWAVCRLAVPMPSHAATHRGGG